MAMSLQLTVLDGIPTVTSGADLPRLISLAAERTGATLGDDDLLVVAQKIVYKAEGRLVRLADVRPSERARELARRCEKIRAVLRTAAKQLAPLYFPFRNPGTGSRMTTTLVSSGGMRSVQAPNASSLLSLELTMGKSSMAVSKLETQIR